MKNQRSEYRKTLTRKRNPNDTTFRNINALKRRVTELEKRSAEQEKNLRLLVMALLQIEAEKFFRGIRERAGKGKK